MSVVLRHEHTFLAVLILYGGEWGEVRQVVGTDDHATGVYTHLTDRSFESCGVLEHRACVRIARLVFTAQFLDVLIAITEVDLRFLGICWQPFHDRIRELAVRNKTLQLIHLGQRNLLYAAYICQGRFRCHLTIGNDMRYMCLSVFSTHIIQHLASSAVLEISIDIREGDTVWVKETLEQQVILEWV